MNDPSGGVIKVTQYIRFIRMKQFLEKKIQKKVQKKIQNKIQNKIRIFFRIFLDGRSLSPKIHWLIFFNQWLFFF